MKVTELMDMKGRVALVTGAASGLGLAMAESVAEAGGHVVMTDINGPALRAEVARLLATGLSVDAQVLDVADLEAIDAVMDTAVARHKRIDAVFANAGISAGPGLIFTESGRLANLDVDNWRRVLDINLTAATCTIRSAARHMSARKYGRIIVTASIGGLRAERFCGYGYVATKAAIVNVVRQAAIDLAPDGVTVNAICPGPFMTNIAGGRMNLPEVAEQFRVSVPLGRVASTDEIKGLALLLASPASSFITGTAIPIDGGCMAA